MFESHGFYMNTEWKILLIYTEIELEKKKLNNPDLRFSLFILAPQVRVRVRCLDFNAHLCGFLQCISVGHVLCTSVCV